MIGAIILQITLIFLNAVFAGAEIAVLSANASRMEHLAESGNKKAKRLLILTQNPSRFLSTIQVAITLAGLLGSAYAADHFAEPLVALLTDLSVPLPETTLKDLCVFSITLILSFFSIVFGELVPKRVAMKNADLSALTLSGLLFFVSRVFAPFVWILTKATNGILRLLRIDPNAPEDIVTEEEIRMMLESGSKKGTIQEAETEMIRNIFEFDDTNISEICTHRREVVILHTSERPEAWKQILAETRFSFYPICGDTADDIVGVLNADKFFRADTSDPEAAAAAATEKPMYVPEHMKADILFSKMRETGCHFALVIDEYGGMQGVITFHDLLNRLVGNLRREAPEEISLEGENRWKISGSADPKKVAQILQIPIPAGENDTFGGYVLDLLGAVPENGATPVIETEDLRIRITSVSGRRIEEALVSIKEKP